MIINANQPETKNKLVDDFAQEITHSDTYHYGKNVDEIIKFNLK